MDASIHDWLEGRGEDIVLISMIDDATSLVLARFYPAGTVEAQPPPGVYRIGGRRHPGKGSRPDSG
jgi:hypothetical protein